MLTYKTQVESTKLRCKKGLSALKAMASKGIKHLFLLHQSVILSVIDYGLGLTTLSQSNLEKPDRVQNEAMRIILGTTKDTPIETMRYLLDLPSMETRHKVEQSVSQCNAESQESTPRCCQRRKGVLTGKRQVMDGSSRTINPACVQSHRAQARDWEKRPADFKPYCKTLLSENLGTHCREWPARKKTMQKYICLSKPTASHMTS